jgi:hypothetical protein
VTWLEKNITSLRGTKMRTISEYGKADSRFYKGVSEPASPALSKRKEPHKVKVREDADPDYAEEAEDFFHGEGV